MIMLLRYWKWGVVALLVLTIGIQTHRMGLAQRGWEAEKIAHEKTVTNARMAAAEAERRALANVVRVKAEQEEITNDTVTQLQARAVDRNARYERLLAQAKAYSSRPITIDLPDTSDATCRAYAGADCDAIPPLLKAAQENTDQLIALIDWTKAQSQVSYNDALDR